MNFIDFTKTGGYRFKQFTLRKMQEAYIQILKAFVGFSKLPELGNFILAGCEVEGANITAGYLYIDGELCRFEQTAGTEMTKIKKNVVIQSLGFKNGNNENVFRFVNAVVDAVDGVALQDYVRVAPVFDANYVRTDHNFTTALRDKLNSLAIQVQADWNVVNPLSLAFIKNKPEILDVLTRGTVNIGDIGNATYPVNFNGYTAPTTNYAVFVSFETLSGSTANNSATYYYVVHTKTTAGFQITMRETGNIQQSLILNYLIIRNPN
jgi:hypothetical protein